MITVKDAAERFGVSVRRVQMLCKEGQIPGAVRWERTWMLPDDAQMPVKRGECERNMPMPRKTPFLHMTDLYNTPGKADEIPDALSGNHEAIALYRAEIAYSRGDMEAAAENTKYFLEKHSGFYAILAGGMLLSLCAIWMGDARLLAESKKHMFEAKCRDEREREIVYLTSAVVDSVIYESKDFPEWFTRGCFDSLPADSHPAAWTYYVKYLRMSAHAIASKQAELEGVKGLALMRLLPFTIEPMITRISLDKVVISEIHMRLVCAAAYHNSGDDIHATEHIDRAIELALPDKLYGVLMQYIHDLDRLLEERLSLKDPNAAKAVKALYKKYSPNWMKIRGLVHNRNIATNLTVREREIAKLSAFGFTIKEIAARLYIAESTVKQTIFNVINKAGVRDRSELASIL